LFLEAYLHRELYLLLARAIRSEVSIAKNVQWLERVPQDQAVAPLGPVEYFWRVSTRISEQALRPLTPSSLEQFHLPETVLQFGGEVRKVPCVGIR
jgi:hypothetical protein